MVIDIFARLSVDERIKVSNVMSVVIFVGQCVQ